MQNAILREVTNADRDMLFEWANDAETRANSFHTAPISFDEHKKWFEKKIASSNVLFFVYRCGGQDIGQIRLDIDGDTACIDYSIDPCFRGKGYGAKMLSSLEDKITRDYPHIRCLRAEVKNINEASKYIFKKLRYTEAVEVLSFRKSLPPPPPIGLIGYKFYMPQELAA